MEKKIFQKLQMFKKENNWQAIVNHFDMLARPGTEGWNSVELVRELGFAHSQLGRFKRAMEFYQRWAELAPGRAQPDYCIGYLFYQQQNYREAILWFDKALEKYPDYLVCLYRKGFALLQLQKERTAHETFLRGLEIYDGFKDPDLKKRNRKTKIKLLFEDGKACYLTRQYKLALQRFQEVLQIDEKNILQPMFKYYNLGKVYVQLGEADKALFYLQKAAELNPEKEYVWERLGRCYHKLKRDYGQAENCYQRALKCKRAPYVLVSRALLYLDMGKEQPAMIDLHEALRKDKKGKHKIYLELGKIAMKGRKFNEAEEYFKRAIDFKLKLYEADYAEAHYYLSLLFQMKGDKDLAQSEMKKASEINPNFVWSTRIENEQIVEFYDLDFLPEE